MSALMRRLRSLLHGHTVPKQTYVNSVLNLQTINDESNNAHNIGLPKCIMRQKLPTGFRLNCDELPPWFDEDHGPPKWMTKKGITIPDWLKADDEVTSMIIKSYKSRGPPMWLLQHQTLPEWVRKFLDHEGTLPDWFTNIRRGSPPAWFITPPLWLLKDIEVTNTIIESYGKEGPPQWLVTRESLPGWFAGVSELPKWFTVFRDQPPPEWALADDLPDWIHKDKVPRWLYDEDRIKELEKWIREDGSWPKWVVNMCEYDDDVFDDDIGEGDETTVPTSELRPLLISDQEDVEEFIDTLARFKAKYGNLKVPATFVIPSNTLDCVIDDWPPEYRGFQLGAALVEVQERGTESEPWNDELRQKFTELGWELRESD